MLNKFLIGLLLFVLSFIPNVKAQTYDLVVYGATGAGITSAVAASKSGLKVLIIEPGKHIGGMVTGGLSHSDFGDQSVIGGLTYEFHKKVAQHYKTPIFFWRGPEPKVAESIMKDWLEEYKVTVLFNKRLSEVIKERKRITKIILTDGSEISGKIFIDAGYEGDLMARANVAYTWGRESVSDYHESYAGRQPVTFTSHQIDARISPFVNDQYKKLLPLINPRPLVNYGEGDKGIQSYCFRLIATNRAENMVPWTKPKNYNPKTYELMRRYYIEKPDASALIGFWPTLPNGKSDINSSKGLSTNLLDGSSWEYPEANYQKRDSIWQWHRDYTLGLAWFLSSDPSVPKKVKDEMKTFGLCKDEYIDNDNFPHQLYVREARRMKGSYFMTQRDLQVDTIKYDAIAMSSYNIDVREMQRTYIDISRFPDLNSEVYNEGYLSIPVSKYAIPYRSIIPNITECENLLVPVCLSGSHLSIASIRMEPTYMILGESAGIAAALAIESNRAVQKVDVEELQNRLINSQQIISLEKNPYGLFNTEDEIIIDNNFKGFSKFFGNWIEEETVSTTGRYAMNFRIKPLQSEGIFEFHPYFFKTGMYQAYISSPSSQSYSNKVMVKVSHSNGVNVKEIDQQTAGGKWLNLGNYNFTKGKRPAIQIIGKQGETIVADAVKFVWTNGQ